MSLLFNTYYDKLMRPLEKRVLHPIRKQLVGQAEGIVLEVGSGTGVNFQYYRHVDKVMAIEPDEGMLQQSLTRINQYASPIEIIRTGAECLPFPDDTFDSIVCTLVFCTIPDPLTAWREIKRVCKPGGSLFLLEHVRINHSLWGVLQDWLTPGWKRCFGGCCLNRNTVDDMQLAGFRIEEIKWKYRGLVLVARAINKK